MNVSHLQKHISRPIAEHCGFVLEKNPDFFRVGGVTDSLQNFLELMQIDGLEQKIHSLSLKGPNGLLWMCCNKDQGDSLGGQLHQKIKTLLPTPKLDILKHHIWALLSKRLHGLFN